MFIVAPSQIEKFRNDGFLIVENLIDDEAARTMHACFERLFRGEFETGITPDEVNWQEGESDPTLTRQICNGWKADRTIAQVILRQDLGQAIAQLGGWPGARIMVDNLIWKPADTRSLGYHQDSAFLSWYAPSDLLSCWIALDDTTAAGGTLEFVRGSHKWKQRSPEGEFHGPEDYRKSMQAAAAEEGVEPDIVYVEVPRGGGSFHDGWTWHGSGHNRSRETRRSLVLHAMRSDTRYVPGHLGEGVGRVYSRYKHLADNDIDENYFPVLWRDDGYRTPAIEAYLEAR